MTKEIKLGDVARDSVSGFEGVVVAYCNWLHGCARLTIAPKKLTAEGKPVEMQTFDLLQLELVETRNHKAKTETGGPRPEPTRNTVSR